MSPSLTHLQALPAPLARASSSAYRCGPTAEGQGHAPIAAGQVLLDCFVRTLGFANGPGVKA